MGRVRLVPSAAAASAFAVLGLTAAPPPCPAANDGVVVEGDLGKRLDEAVVRSGGADFWGSVLVAREGRVVLAKSWGLADYRKAPNTPSTLFEIASASKQVTATAILRLEQDGRLATSDTLPRFFDDVPADKKGITVQQLLTHTSGISGNVGVPYASPVGRSEFAKTVLREPLATPPGTRFEYGNAGYALLAAIVEEVTKKDFEHFVEATLFGPAGLTSTGFIGDADLVKSPKVSARRSGEPGSWTAARWHWGWGYRGMGGVVTTVWDLHRWDRALRGDKVLKSAARRKLVTPALEGYACGWRVETTERGTTCASHSGSVAGFGCDVVRFLEDDAAVFVLSNDPRRAVETSRALQRELFPPVAWEVEIDAGGLVLGEHRVAMLSGAAAWRASAQDGKLRLRLTDGGHTAATLVAPLAAGRGLAAAIDAAVAGRPDDGAPALEAGLFLIGHPGRTTFAIREGLTVRVQPEYRGVGADGRPVTDPRPVLIVDDTRAGQWPVMVKMNVAAARALAASLRKAADG